MATVWVAINIYDNKKINEVKKGGKVQKSVAIGKKLRIKFELESVNWLVDNRRYMLVRVCVVSVTEKCGSG